MQKRINVFYAGHVQGVGFRYTARDLASILGITGWVKNLPDGRVELLAEGEEAGLKEFLQQIKSELGYFRFTETINWLEAANEFNSFGIRF